MPRQARYYNRDSEDDDEFELQAFREDAVRAGDDGASDTNSESGLGDSPEDGIEDHDSDDSDSSEAPEDVCFAASREKEQKRMEDILNQIKKDRADKKDRLRKKDDLFKQQKQQKLAALSKRKLPEDFLEAVADTAEEKKQKKNQNEAAVKGSEETDPASLGVLSAENELAEDISDNETDDKVQDFLPLAAASDDREQLIKVVALSSKSRSATISQKAASFKQSMLYGGRIKRIDSQQQKGIKAKRKARRKK
ncbi:hypothetical protein C0Q70_03931 [Pomacea canaliculata]|uniref:Uncharacterized protein n=1 Tax=Pomacea canaliculata TaxID=400727 RepID=A0A2T7PU49_POMCA|nr:nucleolar protein 7-like isoform X2 [Pomacea canaliculata]PVD36938.1 hypothetical protein C0Q70_03931 [Pomacea canaliculata]